MAKLTGHNFYRGVTVLNSQDIAQIHTRYQPFLDHLIEVTATLNHEFEQHDIPVRVEAEAGSHRILRGNDAVNRFLAGESDGTLHQPQLQTFVEVLATLLANPTRNIAVNGVTQCGKTGTSNATYFLGPIMYLIEHSKYATVMLTINRQSSYDQTNNEFERFLGLYGNFLNFCRADGEPIEVDGDEYVDLSYSAYWEHILRGVLPRELGLSRPTDQLRRRSHGKSELEDMRKLFAIAKDEKAILALLVDETHFGSEVGGTQDIIFNFLLEDLKSTQSRNIFIGFSATNWELCNLDNVSQVMHRLGEGYCGFNFFNGMVVDPVTTVAPLTYYGISAFQREFGFTRLEEVRNNVYSDAHNFEKNRTLSRLHRGFWNYQRFVEDSMIDLIHWALGINRYVRNKPINPNPQSGKGFAIRFCTGNDKAREFIQNLKHQGLDSSIDIIEYFAGGNRIRVKDCIARRPNPDNPYVIVMTASGRLADSFPSDCTYYIDFTHQSQTYTALMQGTVGRATGYHKHPLVLLSDENAERLALFIRHEGSAETGKVSLRVAQTTPKGRGQVAIHLLRVQIKDALILKKFDELGKDLWQRYLRRIDWDGMRASPRYRSPKGGKCLIWDIFDETILTYVEDNASRLLSDTENNNFQLLRPGQIYNGNTYETGREGGRVLGLIGLRKGIGLKGSGTSGYERFQTKSDATRGSRKSKNLNNHRPQIHYDWYDGHEGEIIGITLRCERPFHRQKLSDLMEVALPNTRSQMIHFATDEERETIDNFESGRK